MSVGVTASTSGNLWVGAVLADKTLRAAPLHSHGYALLRSALSFARDMVESPEGSEGELKSRKPKALRTISAVAGFSGKGLMVGTQS